MWEAISRFVLSPQSDLDKVRRYLERSRFVIAKEAMVEEEGKFYTVIETFWNNGSEGESGGTDKKQSWYVYGKRPI